MRCAAFAALLVPALATAHAGPAEQQQQKVHAHSSAIFAVTQSATPASVATSSIPAPTQYATRASSHEHLDLRKAPEELVLPVAQAAPRAPPNAVPVHPQPPAAAPATEARVDEVWITVQWQETMVGGTSKTWIPKTITINFPAVPSQAPLPGVGKIGMGTLTGQVGVTKTIMQGAAPTVGPGGGFSKGLLAAAAAVGAGVAGMAL